MTEYFKHGDVVPAAKLNQIVTTINNAEATSQLASYIVGARHSDFPGVFFYMYHAKRWLAYRSTGEIRDFYDQTNEDKITVLPDCSDDVCLFDLHTVPWLKYGMVYIVEGSNYAAEMDTYA